MIRSVLEDGPERVMLVARAYHISHFVFGGLFTSVSRFLLLVLVVLAHIEVNSVLRISLDICDF